MPRLPAPRFGAFLWCAPGISIDDSAPFINHKLASDTPYSLALAALQAIPVLSGTKTGFAWTVYTGDLVSHDPDNQLSRYVFLTALPLAF